MTNHLPQDTALPTTSGLHAAPSGRTRLSVVLRLAAALFGGYAFTWGFTALGVAGLVALGVDFHEAEKALLLLAFLVFLPVFLWAVAAASLTRVWAVVGGGAVFMTAAAWGLQRMLLS